MPSWSRSAEPYASQAERTVATTPSLQEAAVSMTYRPSRGVRVPIGRSGLALADARMEAEFVDADVAPLVVERLPWVCVVMAVWDALHLAARTAAWPSREGGAPMDARLACACLLPAIVAWTLLALAALAARTASARPGAQIPLRALSAALAATLFLDALPLDVLAQPSLLRGERAAPALAALALQQLVAPVAVSGFCPLAPMLVLVSGLTAVCAFALAGSRAGLDAGVVAQCAVAQAALVALLVAHRWDAGVIARRHFCRARQAWLSHMRTLAAKQNADQLHAAVLERKDGEAAAAAVDAAATARAELIRILSHDIRGPLLIAANVAGEMEELSDDVRAAPPAQPAPIDCETLARLGAQLLESTRTMSRIVSQLAEFGRAESNEIVLERRAFSLGALVDAATKAAAARADAKGLQLRAPPLADRAASCRVFADFARLAQAIDAGVSNAVNASSSGGALTLSVALAPEIDQQLLELEAEPSKAGWVLVVVRVVDGGAGLSAAKLEAVRQGKVFGRVSESQLNGAVATGVGLAHSRRVLELHDGSSLQLHSDGAGRGCTLELRLRLRRAHADDVCWTPPEAAEGAPRGHAVRDSPATLRAALEARDVARADTALVEPAPGPAPSPCPIRTHVCAALHFPGVKLAAVRRRSSTISDVAIERGAGAATTEQATGAAGAAGAAGAPSQGSGSCSLAAVQRRRAVSRSYAIQPASPTGSPPLAAAVDASRSGELSAMAAPRELAARARSFKGSLAAGGSQHSPSEAGDFSFSKLARAGAQSILAGLIGSSTAASPGRAGGSPGAPGAPPLESPCWLRGGALSGAAARVAPNAEPTAKRQTARAPKPTFPPGFRALYAEDDAVLRKSVILRVFKPLGVVVDEASDGAEALRLCEARQRELGSDRPAYAFVLLDNQMPELTGTQVAEELRARGYAGPLVGLTGDPRGCTDREVFELAGVDVCLDKDAAAVRQVREMVASLALEARAPADAIAVRAPSSPSPFALGRHIVEPTPTSPAKMGTISDDPCSEMTQWSERYSQSR